MALTDADIERYSRQIILAEIGGRGQERLLTAVVALGGTGELAATAARYLVGAGIGTLSLDTAARSAFGHDLRRLNPAVRVGTSPTDSAPGLFVAADLALPRLERCVREARARAVPLLAAARAGNGGWLYAANVAGCAACAAASVGDTPQATPLAAVATGVLGSLLALAAIECALGLPTSAPPLRWFAAASAMLTPLSYSRRADCTACA